MRCQRISTWPDYRRYGITPASLKQNFILNNAFQRYRQSLFKAGKIVFGKMCFGFRRIKRPEKAMIC
jgi:hypothetical protein